MDMTHLSFPEEITANIDHALNLGCTLLLSNILFNHYSNSMKKKFSLIFALYKCGNK